MRPTEMFDISDAFQSYRLEIPPFNSNVDVIEFEDRP